MLTTRLYFSLTQGEECPGDQQKPYMGSLAPTSGAGVSSQNPRENHSQPHHPLLWNRACVCRTLRPIRHRRGARSPAAQPWVTRTYACPQTVPSVATSPKGLLPAPPQDTTPLSWRGRVAACQALACGHFGKSEWSGAEFFKLERHQDHVISDLSKRIHGKWALILCQEYY